MLLNSDFIKQAFPKAENGVGFSNPSMEAKRQAAIEYLGEKWLLHPNNQIKKKTK